MFNASSPVWDGSLGNIAESGNLTISQKDIQSTNNNILYWTNN